MLHSDGKTFHSAMLKASILLHLRQCLNRAAITGPFKVLLYLAVGMQGEFGQRVLLETNTVKVENKVEGKAPCKTKSHGYGYDERYHFCIVI